MAPPYHQDSSPPSSFHETDLHFSDHLFFPSTPQAASSSSSSSLSFPMNMIFPHDHTAQDHVHGGFFNTDAQQLQLKQEGGVIVPCNIGSSYDMDQTVGNDHPETGLRLTINWKKIDKSESSSSEINHGSMKWSSSKMRLVMNSDQTEAMTIDSGRNFQDRNQTSTPSDQTVKRSYNNSLNDGGNAIIRTCSDCNTTKTPLWRSGPRGPKSLCNACGIRQRKARRAMAAAAEAAAGCSIPCGGKPAAAVLKANKVQQKAIKRAAAMNGNLPHTLMKKKCKESAATTAAAVQSRGRKKICFEDIAISGGLSESSSAYQRVFPQDEREAAILLMTLSYGYGLLHG